MGVELAVALSIDLRESKLKLLFAFLALLIDSLTHLRGHSELLARAWRGYSSERIVVVVGHLARDELVLLYLFSQVYQLPLLHSISVLSQLFDRLVILLVISVLRRDVHARDCAELIQNYLLLLSQPLKAPIELELPFVGPRSLRPVDRSALLLRSLEGRRSLRLLSFAVAV